MLQAELHNKDSSGSLMRDMEDVLTSNVFGILKNVDSYFLKKVLQKSLGISFSGQSIFELTFWPTNYKFDLNKNLAAEPDCLITTEKYIILIEAKYHSDFGIDIQTKPKDRNQLKRECALLAHLKNEQIKPSDCQSYLLIVTEDLIEPVDRISSQFSPGRRPNNVFWNNWQGINQILKESIREYDNKDKVSLTWIEELTKLLDYKGLRAFKGFEDTISFQKNEIQTEYLLKKDSLYFDSPSQFFEGYKSIEKYLNENNQRIDEFTQNIFFR